MFRFLFPTPLLLVMKIRAWSYFCSYHEEACIFDCNTKLNHILHFSYKCKSLSSFLQRSYRHRSDFDSRNIHTSSRFRMDLRFDTLWNTRRSEVSFFETVHSVSSRVSENERVVETLLSTIVVRFKLKEFIEFCRYAFFDREKNGSQMTVSISKRWIELH